MPDRDLVAIAELAYRESVTWARERQAFGKSLSGFQVVRHKLADMASQIAGARALLSESTQRHLRGEMVAGLAAMTKNVATDMAMAVCDQAVQIHGGYGTCGSTPSSACSATHGCTRSAAARARS